MMLKGLIKTNIADAVRQITNPAWNSALPEVVDYRMALLAAQKRRCAYCRRRIYRDEVGHRELDHVAPKSQTPTDGFKLAVAQSNRLSDRRHTRGYPAWRFEPENLVVACKRCNSFKGTFDPLTNRAVNPPNFLDQSDDYVLVHPHFDTWNLHIERIENMLYKAVSNSPKGRTTISVCGLDRAEELTTALLHEIRSSTEDLCSLMLSIALRGDPIDIPKAGYMLHKRYGVSSADNLSSAMRDLIAVVGQGAAAMQGWLTNMQLTLGTGEAIFPSAQPN